MKTVIRWLKILYKGWMKFAHFIGKINTTILLTFFYFLIFGIAKMITVIGKKDLLDLKLGDRLTYWRVRKNFKAEKAAFLKPY